MLKILLLLLSFVIGCSSAPEKVESKHYEKEYNANFDETWRALQQSIISYPLKVNNMELGQVQTTAIRGSTQFKPPHQDTSKSGGYRYNITINVLKVNPKKTKISILKEITILKDFISDPETKGSDGLEEGLILYRIGREIEIEKALLKEAKKKDTKK